MEYTKGEWIKGNFDDEPLARSLLSIFNKDGKKIAEASREGFMRIEEAEANAILISATPDMYEALEKLMSLDDSGPLEVMAYSGGDVPKKWLREEAPILEARSKARKEVKEIIRKALNKANGRK